jgi:hypothetical protein
VRLQAPRVVRVRVRRVRRVRREWRTRRWQAWQTLAWASAQVRWIAPRIGSQYLCHHEHQKVLFLDLARRDGLGIEEDSAWSRAG